MENRERLTANALACLSREGFHATGVDRLAEQMGVTKRTLYSHFESKDGLINAVLEYRHAQFMQQLELALAGKTPSEIPKAYLNFIDTWTTSPEFYGCLFINACAEYPESSSLARQRSEEHKAAVRARLAQSLHKDSADILFIVGEGMITAAHTGQKLSDTAKEALLKAVS